MASTPSQNNAFELITTGEKAGQWGIITNTNMQIIDRATKGIGSIVLTGTSDEITTIDYTLSDGQYAVLVFSGTAGTVTINPNDQQKVFIVKNTTAGTVTLTQGSGGNVAVLAGKSAIVYADGAGSGAEVVDVTASFDFVTGSSTTTLTNKTLDLASNTLAGTTAEFNTALSDGTFATLAGSGILTNKTVSGADNTLTVDGTTGVGFLTIPPVGTKTASYELTTADVGKYVQIGVGGSVTIPDATFSEGDAIVLFNNTSGDITVTCSITTAYLAGVNTDVADFLLAARGVANILFTSGTECVITGNAS